MQDKKILFSVNKKDLRIDYYRGSGKGGQKRNKTENCCRITHLDSGAVGKSEEGRSKDHNRKLAFKRMTETEEFKKWQRIKAAEHLGITAEIERQVEKAMLPDNLIVEGKNEDGLWEKI